MGLKGEKIAQDIDKLIYSLIQASSGNLDVTFPKFEEGHPLSILALVLQNMLLKLKAVTVSKDWFQVVISSIGDAIIVTDEKENITLMNPVAEALTQWTFKEALGKKIDTVFNIINANTRLVEKNPVHRVLKEGGIKELADNSLLITKNGVELPIDDSAAPIRTHKNEISGVILVFRDVSSHKKAEKEKERLESQLQASQKMESIGQLTGGIAHDFNNLLGIINGYCELSLSGLKDNDPLQGNLKEIHEAGERAAVLTRQLLAFSRRQILQAKVLNLNDILGGTERMLQRLIGEDINLATLLDPGLGPIKADPGQMEQVIMNLAINARDAMPRGGRLTLETKNVVLDQEYADHHPEVQPGSYAMMAVSDTGTGMSAEAMEHVFEPFFTTKEKGKGTGLGLSTVYGIVKQSGGHISIYSEPGHGTTVKIYLPRVDEKAESLASPKTSITSSKNSETILVVEDEERLRKLVCRVLKEKGYTILEASSGGEALKVSKAHEGPIPLLLTDVIMPGLSGRETAEAIVSQRPEIKVLYMSGYTDDAIVRHGVLEESVHFLSKPFTPEALARKVRNILDEETKEGGVL